MEIVHELDHRTWREFVDNHPDSNIFHTPEMFDVFNRANSHTPEIWAAIKNHRLLAILLPVRISLSSGILSKLTTRSIVYGSILCDPSCEAQESIKYLLKTYKYETAQQSLFTELRNLYPLGELQPILTQEGFAYQDHVNYLIKLDRSPEAVFQSIGHRTRKNIRHGLNQGKVVIEEVKKQEDIIICYELIRRTYLAAKVPLADYSLFASAFELLYPQGMIRFSLARVSDVPAAVSVELIYKDGIYGWYSGLDRSFSSYSPNELLMWNILKWGSEKGYRIYDFGGAGNPNENYGVRDFKAKFGGELVCYGRNTWIPHPRLFYLSKVGYNIYRRFLR